MGHAPQGHWECCVRQLFQAIAQGWAQGVLSKIPGLEQICVKGWEGGGKESGLGEACKMVWRGGAEALQPGHRGPVVSADLVGAVGGLCGAYERAWSLCPGGQGSCQCLRCEDSALDWIRIV